MSHLRVRYHAVLTVVLGSFVLLQVLQAQPQQSANSTPTSNGQGSPANAQSSVSVSDPFSVVTSKGTLTNQAGTTTSPVNPLPFNDQAHAGVSAVLALPQEAWRSATAPLTYTVGIVTPPLRNSFVTMLQSPETLQADSKLFFKAANVFGAYSDALPFTRFATNNFLSVMKFAKATSLSQQDDALFNFDNGSSMLLFEQPVTGAVYGLGVAVLDRLRLVPGMPQDPLAKLEDEAYFKGFITPDPLPPVDILKAWADPPPGPADSGALNSSSGTVIVSQLVSDSPPPANGITIETPQFVANPSNDGTEVEVASVPISIDITMSPDGPSIAGQTAWQSGVGSGSPKSSFWGKLNNFAQGFAEFAQSEEGQQFFQSLQRLVPPPTAGATRTSNGNGSMCGPGYVFNSAKFAAVPKVAQLDAQGKSSQGTLLTLNPDRSLTAWCVPVGSRCDQYGRCTWPGQHR